MWRCAMLNQLLEKNDIMVRIGSTWYRLDEVSHDDGFIHIFVSNDDGETFEFDMTDVDEIDPIFEVLADINNQGMMGVA